MTDHDVNRGIGYTVQRIGGDVRVLLPYLDPLDPVMCRFKQPSVTFPSDAAPDGRPFADMPDAEVIGWVRGSIQG